MLRGANKNLFGVIFSSDGRMLAVTEYDDGDPNGFEKDLARYRALKAADIRAAAAQFLPLDKRVELTVEPEKK